MTKVNKVKIISLSGGIIGLLLTNPRKALDDLINKENQDGWHALQIIPHTTTNLFIRILQTIVLFCTLLLWTWGAGYIVLLEKDTI